MNAKIIILAGFVLGFCRFTQAATLYVSPDGNDNAAGTLEQPYGSIEKAITGVEPGDLIYLRGGTYAVSSTITIQGKNGQNGDLIRLWAYPGETPVITVTADFSNYHLMAFYSNNYWHIKGLEITGLKQPPSKYPGSAFRIRDSNHNIFENIHSHHNESFGLSMGGMSTGNLVLNCDFHHNADPNSETKFNNADGFRSSVTDTNSVNTIRGCRSWRNSDDQYDFWESSGLFIIDSCWAFQGGISDGYFSGCGKWGCAEDDGVRLGAGNGFKLGPLREDEQPSTKVHRIVTNCLAFDNIYFVGFDRNGIKGVMHLYNNTSFRNYRGLHVNCETPYVLKNNISHANSYDALAISTAQVQANNTWNEGFSVSDNDFISLDTAGVAGPRQADGSLPKLDFLHLKSTSALVGAGVDVGLPFTGNAPDIGALPYEPATGSAAKPPHSPTRQMPPRYQMSIRGKTVYLRGLPPDAKIIVMSSAGRAVAAASAAQNRVTFRNVARGTYLVAVLSRDGTVLAERSVVVR